MTLNTLSSEMDRVSPLYFSNEKASAKGQRSFEAVRLTRGGGVGGGATTQSYCTETTCSKFIMGPRRA